MTFQAHWAEGPVNFIPHQIGLCLGCDQYEPTKEYEIVLDDGNVERVLYCEGCAEAANTLQAPQILSCKEVNDA